MKYSYQTKHKKQKNVSLTKDVNMLNEEVNLYSNVESDSLSKGRTLLLKKIKSLILLCYEITFNSCVCVGGVGVCVRCVGCVGVCVCVLYILFLRL